MTARHRARSLARSRRQGEAAMVKILYPQLSWQQIGRMVRNADKVKLLGGQTLESALGR